MVRLALEWIFEVKLSAILALSCEIWLGKSGSLSRLHCLDSFSLSRSFLSLGLSLHPSGSTSLDCSVFHLAEVDVGVAVDRGGWLWWGRGRVRDVVTAPVVALVAVILHVLRELKLSILVRWLPERSVVLVHMSTIPLDLGKGHQLFASVLAGTVTADAEVFLDLLSSDGPGCDLDWLVMATHVIGIEADPLLFLYLLCEDRVHQEDGRSQSLLRFISLYGLPSIIPSWEERLDVRNFWHEDWVSDSCECVTLLFSQLLFLLSAEHGLDARLLLISFGGIRHLGEGALELANTTAKLHQLGHRLSICCLS